MIRDLATRIFGRKKFLSPVPEGYTPVRQVQASVPAPAPQPERTFDFTPYQKQNPQFKLRQPPKEYSDLIWKEFGPINQATPAALVMNTENQGFNPNAVLGGENNVDNYPDTGLFQIHQGPIGYGDIARRLPNKLKEAGITSYSQMTDPAKNIGMAKIMYQDRQRWDPKGGWNAWVGPRYRGFKLK